MKHIHTFEQFLNESQITSIQEALQADGLEFVISHALKQTLRLNSYRGYKDNDTQSYEKTLFSLFHFETGYPKAGLTSKFFEGKVPGAYLGEIAKSAIKYLKTGKADENIIEFLAFLYYDAAPGGRHNLDEDRKRVAENLTPEVSKNKTVIDSLTRVADVLKSYSSGPAAARLNLAVAVGRKFSYSAYAGSNFVRVYQMAIEGLRKNKVKLDANSKIEFNEETSNISSKTISNSIGFSNVNLDEWSSYVTVDVDGKEYVIGSFEYSTGYGRY